MHIFILNHLVNQRKYFYASPPPASQGRTPKQNFGIIYLIRLIFPLQITHLFKRRKTVALSTTDCGVRAALVARRTIRPVDSMALVVFAVL